MTELSQHDREFVRQLKDAGVLKDVADQRLDQVNGIILVTCGDGDETPELLEFVRERMRLRNIKPRIHQLALNGGALLIPSRSPVNTDGDGNVMLKHVVKSNGIKGIRTVALYAHAPCGAAGEAGINLRDVVALLFEAKDEILRHADLDVACFLHVDHGQEKRRTYYVSRTAWNNMHLRSDSEIPMAT
ncbi:MAG: hypothetical protein Q8P12_06465 [bacterium]|nr:hypothetical protein [bacterium]